MYYSSKCIILCSQGLTYAEVRITNQQELMDEGFNGFLTCSSQLGLNIGNYYYNNY